MNRHNTGRGTGLVLVVILIAALIVAWLAVTQLRSLRKPQVRTAQSTPDLVQQAQDAVDTLNGRMGQGSGAQ